VNEEAGAGADPLEVAGADPAAAAAALPPRSERPSRPPSYWVDQLPRVEFLGRSYPAAAAMERVWWLTAAIGCSVVLFLASVVLRPDGRGIGTHEQLGLPPCGFVLAFGLPCPSCGFTTTFTLAAHLRPVEAFVNQPFGFLLFVVTVLSIPLSLVAAVRGISLLAISDPWPWGKMVLVVLAAWLAAWGYKCLILLA
jgi:Protein of unknown function (DUF2752)